VGLNLSSLALLAAASSSPLDGIVSDWWIFSANETHVSFVLKNKISGSRTDRIGESLLIGKRTENGVKAVRTSYAVNCDVGTVQVIANKGFSSSGDYVWDVPVANSGPIVPNTGTFGLQFRDYLCSADTSTIVNEPLPIMLRPFQVADHFFRLRGLGLEQTAATAIASVDSKRSPKTFNQLLQTFVPTDLQDMVRLIKDPDASE
jgi:hypothetical protein